MSAFISVIAGDRVVLFTDGASYDAAGTLRHVGEKVSCADTVPFAVTSLGNAELGDRVRRFLARQADRVGVDAFFDEFLPQFLVEFRKEQLGVTQSILFQMAAWSESRGAFHTGFQTLHEPERPDIEPFVMRELEPFVMRGPEFDLTKLGDFMPIAGVDPVRQFGSAAMELMRQEPGVPLYLRGTAARQRYMVGGHIDMTTVDAGGVRTERVKVWDDRIGEMIDPFVDRQTVVPLRSAAWRIAA